MRSGIVRATSSFSRQRVGAWRGLTEEDSSVRVNGGMIGLPGIRDCRAGVAFCRPPDCTNGFWFTVPVRPLSSLRRRARHPSLSSRLSGK